MKIKMIKTCGFERIYDGFKNCVESFGKAYGNQLVDYLEHSLISIELEDLTTIETFYLKKFCSDLMIIEKEYSTFINNSIHEEIKDSIDNLLILRDQILKDNDIDKVDCDLDNILPIGCIKYHAIAFFKGSSILAITGLLIQKMFEDENQVLSEYYPGTKAIENKIANLFCNQFYSFIANKSVDVDIVTEYMLKQKFYQYNESLCSPAHVNTLFGDIKFFGNTPEGLQKEISSIKKAQEICPYFNYENSYITFAVKSTVNTFLNFYFMTPFITDHENLRIVYTNHSININNEIIGKYLTRIEKSIDTISGYKDKIFKEGNADINKLNFIYNGATIDYSLQVPLNFSEDTLTFMGFNTNMEEIAEIESQMLRYIQVIEELIG